MVPDVPAPAQPLVPRPGLVSRLRSQRATVLVAGGGYGKSALVAEAARTHVGETVTVDLAGRRGGEDVARAILAPIGLERLTDELADPGPGTRAAIAGALERRRMPILLVLEETDPAHGPAIAALLAAVPAPHAVIAVGRTPPVDAPPAAADWAVLDQEDLAFSAHEAERLLSDGYDLDLPDPLAGRLRDATSGWITALHAVGAVLRAAPSPVGLARSLLDQNVVLTDLVDRIVAALDDDDRRTVAWVAALPWIDRRIARRLEVEGAVLRATAAGIGWRLPAAGRWVLADPVREHLAVSPDEAQIRASADAYAAVGAHLDAAALLRRAGLDDDAAAVLAAIPAADLAELASADAVAASESLPDAARRAHPWLEVQLARLLSRRSEYTRRAAIIDGALPRLATSAPAAAHALEAERLRDLAYFSPDVDPADVARAEELLEVVTDASTRARLEVGAALLGLRRDGDGGLEQAEHGLRRASAAFERAGEPRMRALALRELAWLVHLERGRLDLVLETFDEIEAMQAPGARYISWRVNRADALLWSGRIDEALAEVTDVTRLAELYHDDQVASYAAWTLAQIESMREQPMRTLAAVRRAEHLAGEYMATATGPLFLSQMADALSRAGLVADAAERLDAALARRDEDPRIVESAAFGHAARHGDPEEAERRHEVLVDLAVERFDRPRHLLLLAYARWRAGAPDAAAVAARAFADYDAMGLRDAAGVHEPVAVRTVRAAATALGAPVPRSHATVSATGAATGAAELDPVGLAGQLGLRPRQAEVLLALRTGASNTEIAARLGISEGTVRKHLERVYRTLGLRSRAEAVALLAGFAADDPDEVAEHPPDQVRSVRSDGR